MPLSMTGFARSEIKTSWGAVCCELKSVNHRYLDTTFRLPDNLRELEPDLRRQIKESVSRGKLECSIQPQVSSLAQTGEGFNREAAESLSRAAEGISQMLDNPAPINPLEILKMPGVIADAKISTEELHAGALTALTNALDSHRDMRKREGAEMQRVITIRLNAISEQIDIIKSVLPDIRSALEQRLHKRLQQLEVAADPDRLEQELVLQAQRMDVDEEIDRLESHIVEVRRCLDQDKPVGRRLDFLMQELNREANTLASKSQAVESTNVAVELKVLIEQMREQVQNLE